MKHAQQIERNNGQEARRRILILDDHPMTRQGLLQLINGEADLIVCGEAGNALEALGCIASLQPDLVITDLTLPGKSGLELIREVHTLHPRVSMLVLTMHDEALYAERVLRAGGRGYIMKSEGGEKVLQAIRRVLGGKVYLSDEMSNAMVDVLARGKPRHSHKGVEHLSDREFEVLTLIGQGLSSRQVGQRLCISLPTVGTHRRNLRRKLRMDSGSELVQYAVRWVASQNPT